MKALARSLVPPLNGASHKGQHGCIAVFGGSFEYCGAPYYAGITTLKTGADLCHVFCSKDAGLPIKSFSPELIVHPILPSSDSHGSGAPSSAASDTSPSEYDKYLSTWLPRMHSLIIGPGLGRQPSMIAAVTRTIAVATDMKIPMVIDADGLHMVCQNPDLVAGNRRVVLTPNIAEFRRLWSSVIDKTDSSESSLKEDDMEAAVERLSATLGVIVLCKGSGDIIAAPPASPSTSAHTATCKDSGSPRRCGGQGDVLSGAVATFLAWAHKAHKELYEASDSSGGGTGGGGGGSGSDGLTSSQVSVAAVYGASLLTRTAGRLAFDKHARGMTTPDVIKQLPHAFVQLFDDPRL